MGQAFDQLSIAMVEAGKPAVYWMKPLKDWPSCLKTTPNFRTRSWEPWAIPSPYW